jgi:Ca2+/Na+ antiporter
MEHNGEYNIIHPPCKLKISVFVRVLIINHALGPRVLFQRERDASIRADSELHSSFYHAFLDGCSFGIFNLACDTIYRLTKVCGRYERRYTGPFLSRHNPSYPLLYLPVFPAKVAGELLRRRTIRRGGRARILRRTDLQEGVDGSAPYLLIIFVMTVCADNLVSSIGSVIERTPITKGFICFVVLPTIGNIARPATAVFAAYKNKLSLAIDIVIGSIMQLTLFVMPFVVLLGWAIGQPMQLEFGFLETLCFFLCVFVVNLLVQDRKINYLGGAICVTM